MKKLFVLLMCTLVTGYRPDCTKKAITRYLNIPTYDFSVRLLDRVAQETDGHFVFSPISTWLQLLALADGAEGATLKEILTVTRSNMVCSRQFSREIFNSLDTELSETIRRRSIFYIDNLLDVKETFVNNVETLHAAKVVETDFRQNSKSSAKVTDDVIYNADFVMTVLLVADIANLKANWQSPFNPIYTKREMFYSYDNVPVRSVNMMYQSGFFNFNNIPEIDAQALELPFSDRASMILLLPNNGTAEDLFLKMQQIRMASLLNLLKSNEPRLVNLKMPRFNLNTDIDNMPELLYDMGLKKMFSPRSAEFKKISDYKVFVSMMVNRFDIEVTETGISASIAPETLIKYGEPVDISFNRPFAFLVVDKITNVMLFAGIYSKPSPF